MSGNSFTRTHYNHHDPVVAQDPYTLLADVRAKCPLGHSDQLGGFFFPTTYEGVKRVFSDFRAFTSTEGAGLPDQLCDCSRSTSTRRNTRGGGAS